MPLAHLIALLPVLAVVAAGGYVPDLPPKAVLYDPARFTQSLSQTRPVGSPFFVRQTLAVRIADLPDTDWHQSGGMHGIRGVTSLKYRLGDARSAYAPIPVKNTFGYHQAEMGIVRTYPDGTRFDDVLYYRGKVFEHRTRQKADGAWSNTVAYKDEAARPPGYTGLKVTCASCHNRSGKGDYGLGLNPGGDGVFSDPLDWSVVPKGVIIAP